MTDRAGKPSYPIRPVEDFGSDLSGPEPWGDLPPLRCRPLSLAQKRLHTRVEARLCWSHKFLYVKFRVG